MADEANARTALLASLFSRNPPAVCRGKHTRKSVTKRRHPRLLKGEKEAFKVLGQGAFLKDEILRAQATGKVLRLPEGTSSVNRKMSVASEMFEMYINVGECSDAK